MADGAPDDGMGGIGVLGRDVVTFLCLSEASGDQPTISSAGGPVPQRPRAGHRPVEYGCLQCEHRADILGGVVNLPSPTDGPAVVAFLDSPLRVMFDVLDNGISFADGQMSKLPYDPQYWAHSVRVYVETEILKRAKDAEGWSAEVCNNSGIKLYRGPFAIRLAKDASGSTPSPGRSGARRNFWCQVRTARLPIEDPSIPADAAGANLLFEWGVSDDRSPVVALTRPMSAWDYKGEPDVNWREPVTFTDETPGFAGEDPGLDDEEAEENEGDELGGAG